jgi:hypothetical protein
MERKNALPPSEEFATDPYPEQDNRTWSDNKVRELATVC